MFRNLYEILGVSETASIEEIRDIHKKLVLIYHPDKNPSPAANQKFREIQSSYETLCDPIRRKEYDEGLLCAPISIEVSITLAEMYHGTTKSITVPRMVLHEYGVQREDKTFKLEIAPGSKDKTKYTFKGDGHRLPGKKPGSVIFTIKAEVDPFFNRDGNDLISRFKVTTKSLTESKYIKFPDETLQVLGFHIGFPVHILDLNDNNEKRFPGLGFPDTKQPGRRGDLVVKFEIIPETTENSQQKSNGFPNYFLD